MRCGWGRCAWRDRDFSLLEVGDHPCVASGPVLVHRSRNHTLGTGSRPARRPHGHERLEDGWVRVGLGPRDTFRRQLLGGRGVVGGGRCLSLNRAQENGAGGRSRRAESRLPGRAARARGPCAPPAAPVLRCWVRQDQLLQWARDIYSPNTERPSPWQPPSRRHDPPHLPGTWASSVLSPALTHRPLDVPESIL